MRRGLKITFVLCPEKVYEYIVVRHELLSIFSFFFLEGFGGGDGGGKMMLFFLLEVLKCTIFVHGIDTYNAYSTIILLL